MITKLSALALVVSLSLFGCKKKEDTDTKVAPAPTNPANPAVTPTPPPAPPVEKPTEPTAPSPAAVTIKTTDEYNTGGLALLTKVVAVFKADGTSCDKIADDITKLAADNDGFLKATTTYEKAHPEAKKDFENVSKATMKDFEAAAGPAMQACKDNKKLTEALAKFD